MCQRIYFFIPQYLWIHLQNNLHKLLWNVLQNMIFCTIMDIKFTKSYKTLKNKYFLWGIIIINRTWALYSIFTFCLNLFSRKLCVYQAQINFCPKIIITKENVVFDGVYIFVYVAACGLSVTSHVILKEWTFRDQSNASR